MKLSVKQTLLIGLSFLMGAVQGFADKVEKSAVGTLSDCAEEMQSADHLVAHMSGCRYFYSKSWGWVDARHFGGAAQILSKGTPTDSGRLKFYFAIVAGELHEQIYSVNDPDAITTYSYEDLVSNFLGASFQYMYNNGRLGQKTYSQAWKYFMESIGTSEEPQKDAPHFDDLDRFAHIKNLDYFPVFATESSLSWNKIQIELNLLRLEVTAFINSSTLTRHGLIQQLRKIPEFEKFLQDSESRGGGS